MKTEVNQHIKRILGIIGLLMTIGFGVFLYGGWQMFGDELKAIKSLKMITDRFYTFEYRGDYGFKSQEDGLHYPAVLKDYCVLGRDCRHIRFEFKGSSDILEIGRIIANSYLSARYKPGNVPGFLCLARLLQIYTINNYSNR